MLQLLNLVREQYGVGSTDAEDIVNSLISDVMNGDSDMTKSEAVKCLIEDLKTNECP
jgi:hypothetical protein